MRTAEFVVPKLSAEVAPARRRVTDQLEEWGACLDAETKGAIEVVVSELVANAVVHGGGRSVTVGLRLDAADVRVEVSDGSSRLGQPAPAGKYDESGRGRALIDALTERTGALAHPRGKTCWAELRLRPNGSATPTVP